MDALAELDTDPAALTARPVNTRPRDPEQVRGFYAITPEWRTTSFPEDDGPARVFLALENELQREEQRPDAAVDA